MPVKIHGKEYLTVAERIGRLNQEAFNYSLNTELVSWEDGVVIMKATLAITEDGDVQTYTGHAYERESSSQINKTSALENCETSAIGRALAAAGFGGTEYASADEVANAVHQQDAPTPRKSIHQQDKRNAPMTMKQQKLILKLMKSSLITDEERLKIEGFVHDPNATISVASDTIDTLTKWIDERELAE